MQDSIDSLHVVCAVITNDAHEILACKRSVTTSLPGKWEFPGGKIEHGETKAEAISREIEEELGVCIDLMAELKTVIHQYPSFHISLYPFLCKIKNAKEPQALEHSCLKWISLSMAKTLDWADADKLIFLELSKVLEGHES